MRLFSDSIGRKVVMAVTGLLMVLFVIGHLLGNLTIFAGPNGINAYAEHLHQLAPLVWGTRIVMGVAVVLHVVLAIQVTLENHAANPTKYAAAALPEGHLRRPDHDLDRADPRRLHRLPPAPVHRPRHAEPGARAGRDGPLRRLRHGLLRVPARRRSSLIYVVGMVALFLHL